MTLITECVEVELYSWFTIMIHISNMQTQNLILWIFLYEKFQVSEITHENFRLPNAILRLNFYIRIVQWYRTDREKTLNSLYLRELLRSIPSKLLDFGKKIE